VFDGLGFRVPVAGRTKGAEHLGCVNLFLSGVFRNFTIIWLVLFFTAFVGHDPSQPKLFSLRITTRKASI